MTGFAADLHIHSRFSRATSKALTIRNLAAWAGAKGIGVLGTGDCTHPAWLAEIERELEEEPSSGLLRLRTPGGLGQEIPGLEGGVAEPQAGGARFLLQGEISSIYKRGGKVRKVHNLVYLPTLEAAKALNAKLSQVGNLASDGRPILGLDSRNLLEMVLETHPQAFLIPAHIWTPWFSLFGSMSGFDSVEECYADLSEHIFAMETGLSSDPAMNWTISALDRYRMVSNSDAHSGEKLAREANLFRGEASYAGLLSALRAHRTGRDEGCEFLGTVEFFPEEGKYHLDGHRKCNWSMEPGETLANRGLCPVCGKPATLGVLHRVLALADRPEPAQPQGQPGYHSMIPLREVLSEVLDSGPATKTVSAEYFRLLSRLGPELFILREAPLPDIRRASPVLAEAVERMRQGKVLRKSGFDGEFGVITVFTPEERAEMRRGLHLSGLPARRGRKPAARAEASRQGDEAEADPEPARRAAEPAGQEGPPVLNPAQEAAASAGLFEGGAPVLVLAGPGTGKTHTLLARVERLLASGVAAQSIAVVTFTRRAADELHERLQARLGPKAALPKTDMSDLPLADTLHALALDLWAARRGQPPVLLSEDAARRMFLEALPDALPRARKLRIFRAHALGRERLEPMFPLADNEDDGISPTAPLATASLTDTELTDAVLAEAAWASVAESKALRNQADFTDLLEFLLALVCDPAFIPPFAHLLVDEVQDLSALQLEAVTGLAGPAGRAGGAGFFAIGDPDQSIYGFRGATGDARERLAARWPHLAVISLAENHRSAQGVLDAAGALLPAHPHLVARKAITADIELAQAPDERREAALVAGRVARLLGGGSLTLMQADEGDVALAPGDIAVLVRQRALIPPLKEALEHAGVPCSAPEAEVFWEEPRVAAILRVAERLFGLPGQPPEEDAGQEPLEADLPEFLLLQGPRVLPAALRETPPFDRYFWDGPAFRDLCHAFGEQGGWVGLLDWVRLETGFASIRQAAQKVRIMTMHAAKGLEFEAVFLPALEDGVLPLCAPDGGIRDGSDLAEERRLLYVAMTRAKSRLCLSHAQARTLYGKTEARKPSPFLADIPSELLRRTALRPRTLERQTQLGLF